MNGLDNPIVFYPLAVAIILFAVASIWFRNIFYSLLSAIMVFFISAVFFYVLGSEYNAVIQIAIYGLAVPVILGLAIMFTNLKDNKEDSKLSSKYKFAMFLTSGLFLLSVIYLVLTSYALSPDGFNISDTIGVNPLNSISAFGEGIFVKYVWAFELVSVILTIIVVGLSIFKRRDTCQK